MDPVDLFERAASGAVAMIERIPPDGWDAATPCSEWDVRALVEHMAGGTGYLAGALGIDVPAAGTDPASYRAAVASCVAALGEPGSLERRCMSPAGFEWSVGEAAAGTAMDQLVHTWDLAVAIDADRTLEPEIVETITMVFLPEMPRIGREAGIVGPEVPVGADGSPQDRLLGAMGRQP
jgi:uncharacterized protein (TIGR03086 family)